MGEKYMAAEFVAEILTNEANNAHVDSCDCEAEEQNLKGYIEGLERARDIIRYEAAGADVVPVRHAKWQTEDNIIECSYCGYSLKGYQAYFNYCPCCGARMDGDKNG